MYDKVQSFGPLDAKIAIVGEAPGAEEMQTGRPFMGKSGGLLRIMLSDAGISPEDCRFMNVMEIRPNGNDFGQFYHDKEKTSPILALEHGRARLKDELHALKPNVILALGNEALKALTGKHGIDNWRGTIHQTPVGKVIATFHPAYILRSYGERPIVQIDLKRLFNESHHPDFRQETLTPILDPSFSQVMEWLTTHQDCDYCAFDTETLGRYIRCLGLSTDRTSAICIPFYCVNPRNRTPNKIILSDAPSDNPSRWTPSEERAVLDLVQKFFASKKTRFIAQNFAFDISVLENNFGLRIENFWLDTMHAHHLVYPEFPMNLDFLTSVYTRLGYYSDYDASSDLETWKYNTMDCIATLQSAQMIELELKEAGLSDFYFRRVHPLIGVMTRVQNRGVLIDLSNRESLAKPIEEELTQTKKRVEETYGITFKKVPSPKQVKEFLESKGIRVPVRKGKQTTDERALNDLIARYPDEQFLQDILDIRDRVKFLGTYVYAEIDPDSRMRTSYNVSGTKGSRNSSSKTLWGTGGNLQNIPKSSFRRVFIVPKGWKFLHADLSQAELRTVIWLSRDLALIKRYADNPSFDGHTFNAARIFKVPEDQVTKDQRQRAKACNHSGNYGISWKKFSYVSRIPYAEARLILEAHQANPFLRGWWQSVQDALRRNRKLITPGPFYRSRIFYGRLDDDLFREAYNWIPQTTVGDIVNQAIVELDQTLDPSEARIILQVHDELDLEVREDCVEKVARLVKKAMEIPLTIYPDIPTLLIPVEISVGPNWWDQEDLKI